MGRFKVPLPRRGGLRRKHRRDRQTGTSEEKRVGASASPGRPKTGRMGYGAFARLFRGHRPFSHGTFDLPGGLVAESGAIGDGNGADRDGGAFSSHTLMQNIT